MNIIKKAALYFARKEFCRAAISECADISVLKEKHTLSVTIGILLIVVSNIIVIPLFFIVGVIAAKLRKPMVGVIGIPLAYGFSWLIMMLGMYLTGPEYAKTLGKYVVRVVLEKILGDEAKKIASNPD
ncbi:MAG: hypothetical protein JW925_04085 [Syntrophaceae bacterium]|nr:hypothetical protein [Syntrophaceae bacterium]